MLRKNNTFQNRVETDKNYHKLCFLSLNSFHVSLANIHAHARVKKKKTGVASFSIKNCCEKL